MKNTLLIITFSLLSWTLHAQATPIRVVSSNMYVPIGNAPDIGIADLNLNHISHKVDERLITVEVGLKNPLSISQIGKKLYVYDQWMSSAPAIIQEEIFVMEYLQPFGSPPFDPTTIYSFIKDHFIMGTLVYKIKSPLDTPVLASIKPYNLEKVSHKTYPLDTAIFNYAFSKISESYYDEEMLVNIQAKSLRLIEVGKNRDYSFEIEIDHQVTHVSDQLSYGYLDYSFGNPCGGQIELAEVAILYKIENGVFTVITEDEVPKHSLSGIYTGNNGELIFWFDGFYEQNLLFFQDAKLQFTAGGFVDHSDCGC